MSALQSPRASVSFEAASPVNKRLAMTTIHTFGRSSCTRRGSIRGFLVLASGLNFNTASAQRVSEG